MQWWILGRGSFTTTVEPLVSDHPKYKAKMVSYGRWSLLTRDQTTKDVNLESYEPVKIAIYKASISAKYCIILKF